GLTNALERSVKAAGTRGTVTGIQPYFGSSSYPLSLTALIEMDSGARPLPFNPCNLPFVQTSANASPPIPFEVGSTTVRQAAVATAASMAFPPFRRISRPACDASGCDVATIPFFAKVDSLGDEYG